MIQLKEAIKKYFPLSILSVVLFEFLYAYYRYITQSGIFGFKSSNRNKLIGKIIADYHVIEKGLTMKDSRPGFGVDKATKALEKCIQYKEQFKEKCTQVEQAIAVLGEYIEFQTSMKFKLPKDFIEKYTFLKRQSDAYVSSQKKFTIDEYFGCTKSDFEAFLKSRRSIRNYAEESVSKELISKAIHLANYSPSSCNRQASRVYIIEDKELMQEALRLQGGNRGFGHLADKLLIVVSELGFSHGVFEKNLAYVDSGIFVGNLLNSLHFYEIAACPLNCYFSSFTERKIRKLLRIKRSEILITMISCGLPPSEFKATQSLRNSGESMLYER